MDNTLFELQGQVKKDPELFKDKIKELVDEFSELFALFPETPSGPNERLSNLIMFLAQVCPYYLSELKHFPSQLLNILSNYYSALDSEFRKNVFSSLCLLRNREQIPAMSILPICFKLFRCQDKSLRVDAFNFLIKDIKKLNKHVQNFQINKQLQGFIYEMIEDANVTAAKKSLHVLMTLYKKRVWTDARTINVIANACLLKEPKLVNIACTFLLRADQNELYSDSSSEGEEEPDKVIVGAKKTKGRIHQKEREANQFKKKQRRKEKKAQSKEPSFLTIDQLNDAQGFVEKMLFNLKKVFNKGKHELQCIMLQVIARVVGRHRLMLIELYSFLQKFVTPKSKKVTQMLIICAEATHELVPPNEIAPVIRKILDNFLSEHCSEAFIVLGLNCMREICKRQPRVMTKDLLDHISTFKNYKNKSVVIACSGLVNLFKEIRPSLLRNKLRPGEEDLVGEYGEVKVHSRVPGAELLEAAEEEKRLSNQSVVIRQPQQKSDNLMRLENTLSRREEIVKNQISQSKVVKKIRKVKEVESDEEISQSDDEESEDIQEEQGCEMEGSGDSDQDEDLIEGSEDEDEIDEDQSNEEEDEEEDEEDEDEEDEDEEEDEEEHKNEEAEGSSDEVSEKDHQDDNLIQEPEDKPIYYRSTTEGIPYECDKILSQNDFNRIKQLQREAEAKRRRMDVDLLNSSDDESNEFVGEDDLETMQVSKQAKIQQSIIDKKEHKRHKKDKKGGKTNKQHAKSKPLMMVMSKKKKSIKRQFEAVKKKIRRSKQQLGKFSKRFNATKRQLK